MPQVAKKKATAAEKDIAHTLLLFSEPWQCFDPLESTAEHTLSHLEREILQKIGRELEITGSAN